MLLASERDRFPGSSLVINRYLDQLILLLVAGILFIDSINGFILYNGISTLSISQIYKSILTILFMARICLRKDADVFYLYLFALALLSVLLIQYSYNSNSGMLVKKIVLAAKFFQLPVSYVYFKLISREFKSKTLEVIIYVALGLLLFNLLLTFLGFGYFTYNHVKIGARGLLFSGNEISGLYIVLVSVVLYNSHKKTKKYIYIAFISMLLSLYIASKTAMIGTAFLTVFIPISRKAKLKVKHVLRIGVVFVLAAIGAYAVYLIFVNSPQYERLLFFIGKGGNLLYAMLSSRDKFLAEDFGQYWRSGLDVMLFGHDYTETVEMDFFDSLFNYGFFGTVIIYSMVLYIFYRSYLAMKQGRYYGKLCFIINTLAFSTSFVAGHLLYSAMINVYLGLVNALCFVEKGKDLSISDSNN